MANKRSCDNIAFKFRKYGFVAESFHGNLLQDERNETLEDFKDKKSRFYLLQILQQGDYI